MAKPSESALFDRDLVSLARNSQDAVIRTSESTAKRLLTLSASLPATYGWRITTPASMATHISRVEVSPQVVNAIYWQDMARSMEAFSVLGVWRAAELMELAIESMNRGAILGPAVLIRAFLELSVAFLRTANQVRNCVSEVVSGPMDGFLVSSELEEALLKRVYGTRIGNPPPEFLAYNVLTDIDKIGTWRRGKQLRSMYDSLCEVAHPNTMGYARFAAAVDKRHPDGSHTLRLERNSVATHSRAIRETTLWAVGWGASAMLDGFQLIRTSISGVLRQWSDVDSITPREPHSG